MSHLSAIIKRELESANPDQGLIERVIRLLGMLRMRKYQLMNSACHSGFRIVRARFKNTGTSPFMVTGYDGRRFIVMPEETAEIEQWSGFMHRPKHLEAVGHA